MADTESQTLPEPRVAEQRLNALDPMADTERRQQRVDPVVARRSQRTRSDGGY